MSYQIILPQFEGPFDLLLFFIERDELDIHNIPIHQITSDFLTYIQQLEKMNIDVASEFILVAASLMRIKAKMLIPRKEIDEDGCEIDPREELVARLLEYKKYKSVIEDLEYLQDYRQLLQKRGNFKKETKNILEFNSVESELESISLYKLMKAYYGVLNRFNKEEKSFQHTIITYNYSVKSEKKRVVSLFLKKKNVEFYEVFDECENRMHCIFSFLAILDLLQLGDLQLQVREGVNNFRLMVA